MVWVVWVFVDSGFFVLDFVSVERTEEPVPLLAEVLEPDAELLPVLAETVLVPLDELLEEDDSVLEADFSAGCNTTGNGRSNTETTMRYIQVFRRYPREVDV